MLRKVLVFLAIVAVCKSYSRFLKNYNLKADISIYKTPDCLIIENESHPTIEQQTPKRNRQISQYPQYPQQFPYTNDRIFDQYYNNRGFDQDKSKETEFHPNPYMYVGYGAAHGDVMDGGYVPQDLRNQRRNGGTYQSKNKFTTHGAFDEKKDNKQYGKMKCISQCVFNNMEIIEENGIPSEDAMLRWAQEKIRNDRKRFLVLKDINKCFSSAPEYVKDDGCDYSKYISNCLNLHLDEDN